MTPAKILVIDDDEDFRQLLVALLQTDPHVRVSGQAGDGEAALDLVRRESPRIVLIDLMMPRVDGIEATRRIKHAAPQTKVVVLSSIADERYRRLAFDNGADVFLNKRDTLIALGPTIRNLVEGIREGPDDAREERAAAHLTHAMRDANVQFELKRLTREVDGYAAAFQMGMVTHVESGIDDTTLEDQPSAPALRELVRKVQSVFATML